MILGLEQTIDRCIKLGLDAHLTKSGDLEVSPARSLRKRKQLASSIQYWKAEIARAYLESRHESARLRQ